MTRILPVLTVSLAIVAIWYVAAVWMNSTWTLDQAARAGTSPGFAEIVDSGSLLWRAEARAMQYRRHCQGHSCN